MPKRTNDFQRLVLLIEQQVQPKGFTVEESAEVIDRSMGEVREIDVLITGKLGGHSVSIAVEAIDHSRPASVEWIDRMVGKYLHQTLPVNKVVAVSRAGFTKAAREKAESMNIETISFKEALHFDWTTELDTLRSVEVLNVFLPYATAVNVGMFEKRAVQILSSVTDLKQARLRNGRGEDIGTLSEYVDRILSSADVVNFAVDGPADAPNFSMVLMILFEETYVIDSFGQPHRARQLTVHARAHRVIKSIPLERQSFGDVQVGIGTGESFGRHVQVAAVQEPGEKVSVKWSIPEGDIQASFPEPDFKTFRNPRVLVRRASDLRPFSRFAKPSS